MGIPPQPIVSKELFTWKEEDRTVEPVLSGTVLSGHPLLSGQFSKSRKLLPLIYCNFDPYEAVTSIKRSWLPFGKSQRDFFYCLDLD